MDRFSNVELILSEHVNKNFCIRNVQHVVTTIIYMKNDETMNYHVTETNANLKKRKGKPGNSLKTEDEMELKITDSTEKTYSCELTYSGFKSENGETDLENALAKIMEGVTIKFQTDEIDKTGNRLKKVWHKKTRHVKN